MREILVNWVSTLHSGLTTVTFWSETGVLADQRQNLHTLFDSVKGDLSTGTTWTVATTGRLIDETTGAVTGGWSEPTARTGSGTSATDVVPDAAQVLLRWKTPVVLGGRFVQGRSFIPGLVSNKVLQGNLAPTSITSWNSAATTFVTAADGFGIWHRPTSGSGGAHALVTSASVWSEIAVLRRRRL